MKTLVIGDIHGCQVELLDLLEQAGLSDGDEVIALGDVVDRGPETPAVLDFFRATPGARSLMGNHERKHVRWARHELRPALSQLISREQLGPDYPAAVMFMTAFPLYLERPEAILVHGYLEPGLALPDQLASVLCGTMGGDSHLRARYTRPWYELYEGEKPVIAGHQDYLKNGQPFVYHDQIFGLDTSCVLGKTLTGLLLPNFRLISVSSRANHWRDVRRAYPQLGKKPVARPPRPRAPAWDEQDLLRLDALLERIRDENERILAGLRQQPGFDELTARQQARDYAAAIGHHPHATLLHLARRGELTTERARLVLKDATLL